MTLEQKILAVLRAARKRIRKSVDHKIGLDAEMTAEVDRLLAAGEQELAGMCESGETQVSSSGRFTADSP